MNLVFLSRHSVKAHEVRALASSWALFNSAFISEVLSASKDEKA
jgi:hypothetical protein